MKYFITNVLSLTVLYFFWSYIQWDLYWLRDLDTWRPLARVHLLYWVYVFSMPGIAWLIHDKIWNK